MQRPTLTRTDTVATPEVPTSLETTLVLPVPLGSPKKKPKKAKKKRKSRPKTAEPPKPKKLRFKGLLINDFALGDPELHLLENKDLYLNGWSKIMKPTQLASSRLPLWMKYVRTKKNWQTEGSTIKATTCIIESVDEDKTALQVKSLPLRGKMLEDLKRRQREWDENTGELSEPRPEETTLRWTVPLVTEDHPMLNNSNWADVTYYVKKPRSRKN